MMSTVIAGAPMAVSTLLASLHGMARWFYRGLGMGALRRQTSHSVFRRADTGPVGPGVSGTGSAGPVSRAVLPASSDRSGRSSVRAPVALRVVRVMEAGQARSSVGRMVISGRMEDVCAELDRLAAREGNAS